VDSRIQARAPRTDLSVGAHYEYLRTESTFATELPVEIPQRDL